MTIATGQVALAADVLALMPSGFIGIWHGTIGNIPPGFLICDGNNSTPNLLARFIEGVATAGTNPGATGGATSHLHTMPSHFHTMPSHTHEVSRIQNAEQGSSRYEVSSTTTSSEDPGDTNSKDPGDTNVTDGRPLFYDVAFIMKS